MNMSGAYTEAVLNKPSKPDFVQIILNAKANLGLQIAKLITEVKDLLAHSKKLEAAVASVRNVNSKLVEMIVATERQCCKNGQYSRRDMLEMVGIPMPVRDNIAEQKVCDVFQEIGVDICDSDIEACHRLKDKSQTIVKFANRKDCFRILRVKIQLKGLDPTAVHLPEGTKIFVKKSLCPYYRGIWNKCKRLRGKQKVYQYYTINGLICLQIEESGVAKIITHMVDFHNLFPNIEIYSL